MPLRDHFRPPLADLMTWEPLHGGWPAVIVQWLNAWLPPEYAAGPRIHHRAPLDDGHAPVRPTFAADTDLPDTDEYEGRVYDARHGRRLVAAVEIVSPANKVRPEHRRAFVAKCVALLQQQVSVAIVDLVTTRHFNLYRDVLDMIGLPAPEGEPAGVYAAACRGVRPGGRWRVEAWEHPLAVGRPLPTLPLWLSDELAVPLDLEATYEDTCRVLRIP